MYRMVSIYARKCFGLTPVGGDAPPECATPRVHPSVGTRRPVVSHPPRVWWDGTPRMRQRPPDVAQSLRRRARAPYVGAQQLSSWIETDTFYATCTIDRFGLDLCWQPLRPSGAPSRVESIPTLLALHCRPQISKGGSRIVALDPLEPLHHLVGRCEALGVGVA